MDVNNTDAEAPAVFQSEVPVWKNSCDWKTSAITRPRNGRFFPRHWKRASGCLLSAISIVISAIHNLCGL